MPYEQEGGDDGGSEQGGHGGRFSVVLDLNSHGQRGKKGQKSTAVFLCFGQI